MALTVGGTVSTENFVVFASIYCIRVHLKPYHHTLSKVEKVEAETEKYTALKTIVDKITEEIETRSDKISSAH